MASNEAIDLDALLQQEPATIQNWLKSVWTEEVPPPAKFNWLGLAEAASLKVFSSQKPSRQTCLEWAKIAVDVYEYLAKTTPQASETFMNSLMMLKVGLIQKIGDSIRDPLLEVPTIVKWFFDSLTMPFDQGIAKIEQGIANLTLDDIRNLRRLKNRLLVMQSLSQSGHLGSEDKVNLDKCLQIMPHLP